MENGSGTQQETFRGIQTDMWSLQEKQGKSKMSKMRHCGKGKYYSKSYLMVKEEEKEAEEAK